MEFFNNKPNDYLKFKLNSEGVDEDKIEARLILTTKENKNYFIMGEVNNGICKFDVPELSMYEKGDYGKVKFEIISEDLYFPVWEDSFEVKTKSTVKIEEMISEMKTTKPKITVSVDKPEHKPEQVKPKVEPKLESKKEEDTDYKSEIQNKSDNQQLKSFSSFFKEVKPINK